MKRIAILLFAAATMVAAQTAADTSAQEKKMQGIHQGKGSDTVRQGNNKWADKDSAWVAERMQKKMKDGIDKSQGRADSAKLAAKEMRKELHGKSAADSAKILKEHNARNQERLQNAIDALDRASSRTNAQVEEVKARTQSRLQEKKAELEQLQEKLRAKRASKDNANETATD